LLTRGGKQFTVTVGTVFEDSHIPLSKWLLAIHLSASSKKGMSAHQLHRNLGISYKAAWFMAHRLRYAMKQGPMAALLEGVVEVDETYVGSKVKPGYRRAKHYIPKPKAPVVALVERETGRVRALPMPRVTANNLWKAINENVAHKRSLVVTDEAATYTAIGLDHHATVNHHSGEYVRGAIHTNTVEGFFSLLKRGINGVYHHVSTGHLQRYCDEFASATRTARSAMANGPRRLSAWPKASGSPSNNQQALAKAERERFKMARNPYQLRFKLGL
jgi:hypothetical protein